MILKLLSDANSGLVAVAADHLWQSTLFACIAGAGALALRKSEARIRYGLWLAASVKFLIPFVLLTAFGSHLAARHAPTATNTNFYSTMAQVSEPFSSAPVQAARQTLHPFPLPQLLALLWLCGVVAVAFRWAVHSHRLRIAVHAASLRVDGREPEMLRRVEGVIGLRRPIPLMLSSDSLEPGVFGIFRPVLIWPEGISRQLDDAHLAAIFAHEVWHVRRRDNLTALVHMFIEAVFWFHPFVWWIGARLLEERERACDEAVLRLGNASADYAQGILKTCTFCVESPLACASGVSGSNLKRRIERIMNRQLGRKLSARERLVLASFAAAIVVAPLLLGFMNPGPVRAQATQTASKLPPAFNVVSFTPNTSGDQKFFIQNTNSGLTIKNASVKQLIELAYGLRDYELSGGPDWINSDRYDLEAKPPAGATANPQEDGPTIIGIVGDSSGGLPPLPGSEKPPAFGVAATGLAPKPGVLGVESLQSTLQSLLATRFNLKLRSEINGVPVYALLVSGSEAKLIPAAESSSGPGFKQNVRMQIAVPEGRLSLSNATVGIFADQLSGLFDHPVVDKTNLTGRYEIALHWTPPSESQDRLDAINSAMVEQLGLRLEQQQAPREIHVIDGIDRPSN